MSSVMPPVEAENTYQKGYWGVYGEFGAGANARVRYVQTVMKSEELSDIKLISNIPGSETWDVVDLFQRDVDNDRVKNGLIPYLEDYRKIKFFNPLTLLVLPMDASGKSVSRDLVHLTETTESQNGKNIKVLENRGFYQLRVPVENDRFAEMRWNAYRCFLVAIDGQHRLSAISRILQSPQPKVDITGWRVPIVILIIEKELPDKNTASLLELVRNTFVYINTTAVRINPAREILLNDESPTAVCTQELVQDAHKNDNRPLEERDQGKIPLLLLDWRGETSNGIRVPSPAALKGIEEIHSWISSYIVGEDFSDMQKVELELVDLVPPLSTYGKNFALSSEDSQRIREQFRKLVLPGVNFFLQNFEPYQRYIRIVRELEKRAMKESDIAQHAFTKLRFGSHNAPEDQIISVDQTYESLVHDITTEKDKLDVLLKRDIGMRGIMYAFGNLKKIVNDKYIGRGHERISWLVYAERLVSTFNRIYKDGWLSVQIGSEDVDKKKLDILNYIVFDIGGGIINYRIDDSKDAFGALLTVLAAKQIANDNADSWLTTSELVELWSDVAQALKKTISREIRKAVRAKLKDEFFGTVNQFNSKVKEDTEEMAELHIAKIAKHLHLPEDV